ncbi:F-box containing protein [Marseillevirus Shanghai 1]|nr:F-box containing protein [Marseillevirus Shanghai 1]
MSKRNVTNLCFHHQKMEPANLSSLPAEMVLSILTFVESIKDINSFRRTCSFNEQVVASNDMALLRKVHGKTPWSSPSDPRAGEYTVSPRGILHGRCKTTFRESFSSVNYKNGKLDGVETIVYQDRTVERGLWRDDRRFGLWKAESLGYRESGLGAVWAEFYDERGLVYSHERTGDMTEFLVVTTEDPDIEIRYIHEQFEHGGHFFCEKESEMHYSGFVKYIFEKGRKKGAVDVFYTCCEEHYRDMPAHLVDIPMIQDKENELEIPCRTPVIEEEYYEYDD